MLPLGAPKGDSNDKTTSSRCKGLAIVLKDCAVCSFLPEPAFGTTSSLYANSTQDQHVHVT